MVLRVGEEAGLASLGGNVCRLGTPEGGGVAEQECGKANAWRLGAPGADAGSRKLLRLIATYHQVANWFCGRAVTARGEAARTNGRRGGQNS